MLRFAANVSMLFAEAPFLERFALAARAGFAAVAVEIESGRRASRAAGFVAGCVLAFSACAANAAQGVLPGDGIKVDVSGRDRDVVRLIDVTTHATIAWEHVDGEPMLDSLVSPDNGVVAIRHGAGDGGDSLSAYAIVWAVDAASGAKVGKVSHVLDYRPRDGHLSVSLRQVPNGTVMQVRTGRHTPFWNKIFFYDRAAATWYEWPRALDPHDPTSGIPKSVGTIDTGDPYAAWLRLLDPHGD